MTVRIYIVMVLLCVSGYVSFFYGTRVDSSVAFEQEMFEEAHAGVSPHIAEKTVVLDVSAVDKDDDNDEVEIELEKRANNETYQNYREKQPSKQSYLTYNSWNNPMLTADKITIPDEYEDKSSFVDLLISRWNGNISEEENDRASPVFFTSLSPEKSQSLYYNTNSFSPYAGRIYSCIESNDPNFINREKILIKWYNSNDQVLYFDYLGIDPAKKYNYIWFDRSFWDTGIYNVEIFELENNIRLLASGSFIVSDLNQYIGHLGLYDDEFKMFPLNSFSPFSNIFVKFRYSSQMVDQFDFVVRNTDSNVVQHINTFYLNPVIDGFYEYTLKNENDNWKVGSYVAELMSRNGDLAGRAVFTIAR